jgi:hypothetical protein
MTAPGTIEGYALTLREVQGGKTKKKPQRHRDTEKRKTKELIIKDPSVFLFSVSLCLCG